MTAMSWSSAAVEEQLEKPVPHTTQHTFRRGTSAQSFTSGKSMSSGKSLQSGKSYQSWKSSGSTPSKTRRRKRKITKHAEDPLEPGERRICFDMEGGYVQPTSVNELNMGNPNQVRTAKFTVLTWLPKSLYFQFHRVANVYFLFIAVIVCFSWSPKNWKSKIFPFAGVLLWTALKDLHEDMQRRRDDQLENNQEVLRFDIARRAFATVKWADVLVSDLVLILKDGAFPADLILLRTNGCHSAFVSTVTLDGETNLKERRMPTISTAVERVDDNASGSVSIRNYDMSHTPSEPKQLDMKEEMEEVLKFVYKIHVQELEVKLGKPEAALSDVRGLLSLDSDKVENCPANELNFLPRGCTLRNTGWALAVVAYCGDETKARLNTSAKTGKMSNMQVHLNHLIWGLLFVLFALCIYSASVAITELEEEPSACCGKDSWVIMFLRFCITFYHVVPMSLYVIFEMLKLVLGYQVKVDPQMVDPETKEGALARTSDLVEELGQINFVFSDKTGTLTRNEMVFARCFVGGCDLGDFRRTTAGEEPAGVRRVGEIIAGRGDFDLQQEVRWFFTCLATCHSVQVLKSPALYGDLHFHYSYSGMSPDEVALVQAANEVGFCFDHRHRHMGSLSSDLYILGPGVEQRRFLALHELEFTSSRKRMSVILRSPENELWLVTKGADNILEGLLAEPLSQDCKDHLRLFSRQGLRTLLVACKRIDQKVFDQWEHEYKAAQSAIDGTKDEQVELVAAKMETGLRFLGITAVEDRLQDGVADAIATIKKAGVRLWVLTGDKRETAVDIAHSCLLFTEATTLAKVVDCDSVEEASEKLTAAQATLADVEEGGLVLDGKSLGWALQNQECKRLIYNLGLASRSCVCCRLSPMQKRQLVDLVREMSPSAIVLAIGDGANDVPMIEGAHVGIGMRGREGASAVQVCDIAISQFRFLVPLLLCHGRRAYRRVAFFLLYYLYKNVVLAMGDVIWMHQHHYLGGIAFPEYLSINYNVLFAAWHILFVLGFDKDVPDHVANSSPDLYLVGPMRKLFNGRLFVLWMLHAVFHGCVCWLLPNLWFGGSVYIAREPVIFWLGSITSFSAMVATVNLKLILCALNPFKATTLLPSLAAMLLLLICLFCLGHVSLGQSLQPNMKELPAKMFSDKRAFAALVATPFACLFVDAVEAVAAYLLWPSPLQRARARLRKGAPSEGTAKDGA